MAEAVPALLSTRGHGDASTAEVELAVLQAHDADVLRTTNKQAQGSAPSETTDTLIGHAEADHEKPEAGDLEENRIGTQDSSEGAQEETDRDPDVVDWDGADDPRNPMNWPESRKWINVAVISSITFITLVQYDLSCYRTKLKLTNDRPLASSMFAPGVPEVMTEFKSTDINLSSFVVSVYVLGYAFGPIIIAPLSELYGRLPLYHTCNVLFVILTVACALSSDLNMLIGFRFLEGTFGSAPLTIGGGTIADMIIQEKRGGVMAIWAMGPLMGPVIGPVAGGFLSQAKGWRWVFWVIAMAV